MINKKRLFLIDAYALIFRGYYAFIKNPRINSKGLDTSAILGFTNSLFDVIKREKPDYIAVCFDKGGSQDRIEIFEDYKANREETPEGIKIAVPIIEDILNSLNISILVKEGYEADDIIGTIAQKAKTQNFETYMVTPDKDFAQLVEEDIYMYRPVFGGGYETWGVKEVLNKFEISKTSQVIDFLAMKGDSVDNIPGLPGVGDKTAKKFLKEYGSLENLLENTSDLKGKIKEKIEANKELGILSKKLATIITNVPIDFEINEFKLDVKNLEKIREIFDFLEFRRLSSSINSIFSNVEKPNSEIKNKTEEIIENAGHGQFNLFENTQEINVVYDKKVIDQEITSNTSLELFFNRLKKQKNVSYSFLTEGDNFANLEIKNISFSWENNLSYSINDENKEFDKILKIFFEDKNIIKKDNSVKTAQLGLSSEKPSQAKAAVTRSSTSLASGARPNGAAARMRER